MTKLDPSSREGAERLAATIREYWRERGHDVDVRVEGAGYEVEMREAYCVVRSDMINGCPRGWCGGDEPRIVEAEPVPRVAKKRSCLRCRETFQSEHAGNRLCDECREYRPDIYDLVVQT